MLGNMPKLLAFLALFAVAPATANHRSAHHSPCPYERAREEAAAAAAAAPAPRSALAIKAPTTITLNNRLPATDGGVFGFGRSGVLNP